MNTKFASLNKCTPIYIHTIFKLCFHIYRNNPITQKCQVGWYSYTVVACLCPSLSNDVCVSHADVSAQILADGTGKRETVEVAEPIPRVLNHIEHHKEQNKEKQECWYPRQHHDPLHDTKDIVLLCLFFLLLHVFQTMVGHEDSGEEKSKNEAANVSKIINKGEETE